MTDDMPTEFWMVYGLGQGAPTVQHSTFYFAKGEAHRLARNHPGIKFFVLRAVGVAERNDVTYRGLGKYPDPYADDDRPF
jgi:hypothetical protein